MPASVLPVIAPVMRLQEGAQAVRTKPLCVLTVLLHRMQMVVAKLLIVPQWAMCVQPQPVAHPEASVVSLRTLCVAHCGTDVRQWSVGAVRRASVRTVGVIVSPQLASLV